jgi:hypothetical protein
MLLTGLCAALLVEWLVKSLAMLTLSKRLTTGAMYTALDVWVCDKGWWRVLRTEVFDSIQYIVANIEAYFTSSGTDTVQYDVAKI